MSNLSLDPQFIKYVQGIYGDANLSGATIKNLYQTWKTNPEIIKNTFRNKPIQQTKTSLTQKVTPGKINKESFQWAMPAQDDLSQFELRDAAKIAYYKGYDAFTWNHPDSKFNPDGLLGTNKGVAAERAIRQNRMSQNTPAQTSTIQPKSNNYWDSIAKKYGFENIEAVKDWQQQNGLVADGKFGKNSLAKWNSLKNNSNTKSLRPSIEIGVPQVIEIQQVEQPVQATKSQSITKSQPKPNQGESTNTIQPTISRYTMNNTVGGDFGIDKSLRNAAKGFLNWINNTVTDTQTNRNRVINIYGKYQQGGKLDDKQQAFATYLIQVSGAQSEQELDNFVQSQGIDGIKQYYQEFTQKMENSIQSAKFGAKLDYINSLRGICPEGYEVEKYMAGGCVKCRKKAAEGTKVVDIFKEKCGGKAKKRVTKKKNMGGTVSNAWSLPKDKNGNKIEPTDTVHTKRGVYNLTNKKLPYKKLTNSEYSKLSTRDKTKADLKDMQTGRASESPSYNKRFTKKN